VKETNALRWTALGAISSTFKMFLFVIPRTLVGKFLPHGHWVLFGASFIGGALLQTLCAHKARKLIRIVY
jgi:hypothetical protein